MRQRSSNIVKISYPKFSRDELVSLLNQRSKKLSKILPLVCVVLFGSYAKKRQTAASDIDVLVVYEDPKKENDYSIVWDALNIPMLEPHVFSLSEYAKQIKDKTWLPNVARREGVPIYGELP
jgi:uncharacterized protein